MLTMLFVCVLLFFLGAAIGSFLNVVVYRTLSGESWKVGRSHCEHCNHTITWYENIPLLSFVMLGGRCSVCKKPIDITHPVVEVLMGSLFVWWYLVGSLFFQLSQNPFQVVQPLFWLCVGVVLCLIVVIDMQHYIIPDVLSALLLVLALCYRTALTAAGIMQPTDYIQLALAALVGSGFLFILWHATRGKGIGFGDVKLMVPLALLVGWPQVVALLFVAFVSGAVVGVLLMVCGKKTMKYAVPFGPFLIAGAVFSLQWGDTLLGWYLSQLGM